MRSSGRRPLSFCDSLTNVSRPSTLQSGQSPDSPLHDLISFVVSGLLKTSRSTHREPGHTRISRKTDGIESTACFPAKLRATRRIAQSPDTHIASTSVRTDKFRQKAPTNMPCSSGAQEARRARRRSLSRCSAANPRSDLQQSQQIALQRSKPRPLHVRFRVYDEIPSCGNLLAMQPDRFPYPPPNAVAHHRPAQRSLDAEAKAALRKVVRFQEHGEVGTRAALPVAVHSVEIRLAHQTRSARILLPRFTRA